MTVEVRAFRSLSPAKVKSRHPLASRAKSDRSKDTITFDYLGFLHEVNNGLGRNICPSVSDVAEQFLGEIGIIEEGTATRVRMIMVWKCRAVTDEVLAPCSKPSTATGTPPEYFSGIICGLDPSFTGSVDCEKSIELI